MVLPIYVYGNAVLKKKAEEISSDYTELKQLIEDMWETMYFAKGVGLAAPQIGKAIRLFVVDTTPYYEKRDQHKGMKKVFINASIIMEEGPDWDFEEGCLSIPGLTGEVSRQTHLKIKYQDENFDWHEEVYDEMNARVIQHEYDHIEGVLFIEKIKPLRRQMIQRKLEKMKKGIFDAKYPVKLP